MSPGGTTIKEEDEELAALGGKTRLVSRKSPSTPASPQNDFHQHTPSPKGSPLNPFTGDVPLAAVSPTSPTSANSISSHSNGIDQMGAWPHIPYQQQQHQQQHPDAMPWSSSYPVQPGQWAPPPNQYVQMHSPVVPVGQPMQYPPYEAMEAMSSPYVAHSPMEAPLQMADLNASWNSLFAQYQQ